MKKLLAVFLALMMILSVSLMACSDKKENENNEEENENEFVPNSNKENTGTTEANQEEDPDKNKAPVTNTWVDESGTVYVRANNVRIRAAARTNSTVIGNANFGDALQYEGYNDEWYKIKFEGTTAYIAKALVDGNRNTVTFEEHATLKEGATITVTAGMTCNLRTDPAAHNDTLKGSIDSTKTANGELTIVKINKTGTWAEVRFKGTDIEKRTYTGTEILYCTTSVIAELTINTPGGIG